MAITRTKVEAAVVELLQEFLGSEESISPRDKPITGLGLTSLDGVDFACAIEKKLGCKIPGKVNPFVFEGRRVERNVSQVIDCVSSFCPVSAKAAS